MHRSSLLTADPEVHAQLTSTGNSRQGSIGRRPRNSRYIGGYSDWSCKTLGQGWCSRSPVQESRTCSPPIPSTVIIHCDSAWSGAYNCVCQRASLPSQPSRQSQLEQRVRACTTGVCKSAPLKALRTSAFANNNCRHTQAPAHDCWGEHTRQTARHTRCVTVAAATRLAKHKI